MVVTVLLTADLVPDRVRPIRAGFSSPLEVVRATFSTPLPHPNFMWLMASRLLILMGVVGIQSFTLFFFTDAFFQRDRDRSEEHTSELQSQSNLVCRLLLEKKTKTTAAT